MRTLHVGLRVEDLERSLAFYTTLGYDVVGTVPGTAFGSLTMLKLPGDDFVSVELVHEPAAGAVKPRGLNHLVVQVEDLHGAVADLAAHAIHADAPTSPDGSDHFWTAWLTDPDGYRIELVQWPSGHADGLTSADFTHQRPPGCSAGPEPGRISAMGMSDVHDLVVSRADGRDDGEDWTENFQELPGGAGISIILESTSESNVGPRLHKHPYAETFIIRRGSATFTIGSSQLIGRAGQVLVAPAQTPHKFSTGPDGYEAVHIHASPRFVTDWLE